MNQRNLIVLGINADIGSQVAERYANAGFSVLGTYRVENKNCERLQEHADIKLFRCDISDKESIITFSEYVSETAFYWSNFFSSIGTTRPIKRFFQCNVEEWTNSILLNFTNQLMTLHALYPYRNQEVMASVNFMAGGGTNSAMVPYSAYCASKIALIKMCELLDSEQENMKFQILGPGLVKTKIHNETLTAGNDAEGNLNRIARFMSSEDSGSTHEDIFQCLRWLDEAPKAAVGGRNFSLVHDPWGQSSLIKQLKYDDNKFKLRRYGNTQGLPEKRT